jgi:hypothetical protein
MSTTQIPDMTVLAAIDRAERHRGRPGVGRLGRHPVRQMRALAHA